MKAGVTDLLRSMPDLEPPAGGWQRICRESTQAARVVWMGRFAAAASIVIAVVAGYVYWLQPQPELIEQPIMVSAPAVQPGARATSARVRMLQQRSRYMEQLLRDLPPRSRLTRADAAGVIGELQDQIAAVDYQLNRTRVDRAQSAHRPGGMALTRGRQDKRIKAPELWQRRVEYMDQLVRARYSEASFSRP